MAWIIGILTFFLVVDCLLLMLLILIQLPKKEAGLGQAFGSAATDALFGAGSGTALTKITKYATGIFCAITILLAILNAQYAKTKGSGFRQQMDTTRAPEAPAATTSTSAPPAASTPVPAATTNVLLMSATNPAGTTTKPLLTTASNVAPAATNRAPSPATNAPPKPPAEAPQ